MFLLGESGMNIILLGASILFACTFTCFLYPTFKKQKPDLHPAFAIAFLIVPFASGGFSTWTAGPVSAVMLWFLFRQAKLTGDFLFRINLGSVSLLCVLLAFIATPLWAADKGMAIFGFVRFLPVILFALICTQMNSTQKQSALFLIPLSGAVMTLLSFSLQFIPLLHDQFTVSGRLAGFWGYPNTYAAFLLSGIMIQGNKASRKPLDILTDTILVFGVIVSGSRTGFLLLIVTLGYLLIVQRKLLPILSLLLSVAIGIGAAQLLSSSQLLENADRYTTISANAGTFLVRLLYFKDALPVILQNPFGLGYWGYRAMECSFQTGRYAVTYVHNGLLQLLLDVGWIPALLLAAAFLKTMLGKDTSAVARGILLILLAHCMLDFDLQFTAIWLILVCIMDLEKGTVIRLRNGRIAAAVAGVLGLILSLWLGVGDFCIALGNVPACLKITPFHTEAMIYSLSEESNAEVLLQRSQKILDNNPYASIAYTVQANHAFSQGDILSMCISKEKAIACAKYSTEEYCDYLDKLCAAYMLYLQAEDQESAKFCVTRILQVERMLQEVTDTTSPLAYLTGDDPSMALPLEYQQIFDQLRDTVH